MTDVKTITEARNDTSDNKLCVAEGRSLKDGTDNHDNTANSNSPTSSESVANP